MRFRLAFATAALAFALSCPAAAGAAEGWQWPVEGEVITSYRNDNSKPYAGGMHRGIDIAASSGTSVVAARAGRVSYAGNLGSSGLTVAIETADGAHSTSYLHLSELAVSRGQQVEAGRRLGAVGTSGQRSAPEPHLHFGVRLADRDDFYLDPLTLLPPSAVSGTAAPPPVPVAAPVRAVQQPAPVRARVRSPARAPVRVPAGSPAPARRAAGGRAPHVSLHPAPAASRARIAVAQQRRSAGRMPAGASSRGSVPEPQTARVRHPRSSPARAMGAAGLRLPWGALALAGGLALIVLAAAHLYSQQPPWATTSRRRSTTSTPSRTSVMPTRRSRPTSSLATCASGAKMSSS